jgi:hypothetical protein
VEEFLMVENIAVAEQDTSKEEIALETEKKYSKSIGIISGYVRAISDDPKLKLVVYDKLFKTPVDCYLVAGQEDLAREVWRKEVSVIGTIYRDRQSGRPLMVEEIKKVEINQPAVETPFEELQGITGWQPGDETAVEFIRRLRDM